MPVRSVCLSFWKQSSLFVLCALAMSGLGGCATDSAFAPTPKLRSIQDAASVNVTALSVAPWEDYVDALQMQFPLTAANALTLALPQTSITQQSYVDALGLGLQLGLPQNTTAQTLTTNNVQNTTTPATAVAAANSTVVPNSTSNTTQNTSTFTQAPGQLPASALPTQVAQSAAGLAPPAGAIQTDAILLYTAASAIFQEVQILNGYLKDGMLRYGYVPYIMRMQISVMPFARNEPYDTYVDIGVFSKCKGAVPDDLQPAVVVPLLITDDVERGQSSSAEDIARQLALSVSGMARNGALGARASKLADRFDSVLSSSFNSLFMVSRSADNVLEVRIGAAASASTKAGYVSLAQTHDVTFLLLVNREHAAIAGGCNQDQTAATTSLPGAQRTFRAGPLLQVSSTTRMRNVTTGIELLPDARFTLKQGKQIYARIAKSTGAATASDALILELLGEITQNNLVGFNDSLPAPIKGNAQALWTGLAAVHNRSEYSTTAFNLPYSVSPVDIEKQTVFVHDNCKDTAIVSVIGFPTGATARYLADIRFSDSEHRVPATSVTQTTNGSPMTITFPSLNGLARESPEIKAACTAAGGVASPPRRLGSAQLMIRRAPDTRWESPKTRDSGAWATCGQDKCVYQFEDVIFDGSLSLAQTVGLTPGADTIVEDQKNTATVRLVLKIDKDLDGAVLTFNGGVLSTATLPTATGYTLTSTNGGLTIAENAPSTTATQVVLDLPFQSLVAGRELTVMVAGQKARKSIAGATAVVAIPIVAPVAQPKSSTATP